MASGNCTISGVLRIAIRVLQLAVGVTVIGLYAGDLQNARKHHVYVDSRWVWAVVCGSLGSIASVALVAPFNSEYFFCIDAFLCLGFSVAFVIFGIKYIPVDPRGDASATRMKQAVWVLMVNVVLWLLTAAAGLVKFLGSRKKVFQVGFGDVELSISFSRKPDDPEAEASACDSPLPEPSIPPSRGPGALTPQGQNLLSLPLREQDLLALRGPRFPLLPDQHQQQHLPIRQPVLPQASLASHELQSEDASQPLTEEDCKLLRMLAQSKEQVEGEE